MLLHLDFQNAIFFVRYDGVEELRPLDRKEEKRELVFA